LLVARLTMRFNRAWLAESLGDRPDFIGATQEYMAINEEHGKHADTLLRLGAQWQRVGEVEIAMQRYQDAMKTNPVLASLMQAQAHRHQADYSKALQSAETAVRCAGEKQFHYAHVFLGNLYYEVASLETTKMSDRDVYMKKALWNFTRALEHEKDSHYAANGIGMVFAKRGKLDFAKRTFQSVMQHHAMAGDPSVYINLGHTYLNSGGDEARKAVALYQRALKMKPNDLTIRLYLAKAFFGLKEFERCSSVLGDATQIWPDDLLLRYNLAVVLESFGVHLVSMEKKTKRVVGVDSGMDQMSRAVELLKAAARLYTYVHARWEELSEAERRKLAGTSGAPANLLEEMKRVGLHKDYCADITERAREELANLSRTRAEMDVRMKQISKDKAEKERSQKESAEMERKQDDERRMEMEQQAIHIMDSTKDIVLGKNLADLKDSAAAKPAKNKPNKDVMIKGKEPKKKRSEKKGQEDSGGELGGGEPGGEPGLEGETDAMFAPELEGGDVGSKKEKKTRKDKKTKGKDKKAEKDKKAKKGKKRGRDTTTDGGDAEEDGLEEEAAFEEEALEEEETADATGLLPIAEDAAVDGAVGKEKKKKDKDKDKKKEKKDKAEKKDKKEKKEKKDKGKKDKKRQKTDTGGSDAESPLAPRTDEDIAMEEDLFGPDDA